MRRAILLAGVMATSAACWSADSSVPVAEVARGPFVHRIEAEGVLAAEQATVISAPIGSGKPVKIAWLAENGTRVSAGDVVVRFDPTDMERELFTGEIDRDRAQQQSVKQQLEQDTTLANLGRDATMAERQLEHAREFRTADEDIFSRNEIIESQISEELAVERKDHASELQSIRGDLGEVDLALLDLQRRMAQLQIDKARAGLADLEVRAPHDGIFVLNADRGEPPIVGQMAWPSMTLGAIPRLNEMKATVFVLEADAGGLVEGAPARVRLEAHPDLIIDATVRRVEVVAKRRSRWSPVQYFEVSLELAHTDPNRMKPGQRVRATILLRDLRDVIAVPREAVFGNGADTVVFRRVGGGFEPVPVRVGASALGRVVIEEGLEPGDVIALEDPTRRGGLDEPAPDEGPGRPAIGGVT